MWDKLMEGHKSEVIENEPITINNLKDKPTTKESPPKEESITENTNKEDENAQKKKKKRKRNKKKTKNNNTEHQNMNTDQRKDSEIKGHNGDKESFTTADQSQITKASSFDSGYTCQEIEERNSIDLDGSDKEFEVKCKNFRHLLEKVCTFSTSKGFKKKRVKLIPNISIEWIKQLKY